MTKIVIGANYGDEGKGLITDWLTDLSKNPLVIRFNGGSQAAHTVTLPGGEKHIFKHFGSGTLCGAPTLLSEWFIVNPIYFVKELKDLRDKFNITPTIYVDSRCKVTTPWDMAMNQYLERERGSKKHGSCGMGIFNTIQRSQLSSLLNLTVYDLFNDRYRDKLQRIWKHICAQLEKQFNTVIEYEDEIFEHYLEDIDTFVTYTQPTHPRLIRDHEDLIFEGAQGLLLDQNRTQDMPYLTPSNTGLQNVSHFIHYLPNIYQDDIEVIYVTRCYLTRHGAGPLKNEWANLPSSDIIDPTNKPNDFQDSLRFGTLDINLLDETIKADLEHLCGYNPHVSIAMTCMDQWKDIVVKVDNVDTFIQAGDLSELFPNYGIITSHGPTRNTVVC